jgi:hypothetical protein
VQVLTLLRRALFLAPCPACPQDIRNFEQLDIPVYIDPTRSVYWPKSLPTSFSTYVDSETQAQSCVGSGVGCNAVAAPAAPAALSAHPAAASFIPPPATGSWWYASSVGGGHGWGCMFTFTYMYNTCIYVLAPGTASSSMSDALLTLIIAREGPGHPLPRQRLDRVATVCVFALVFNTRTDLSCTREFAACSLASFALPPHASDELYIRARARARFLSLSRALSLFSLSLSSPLSLSLFFLPLSPNDATFPHA